MIRLLSVLFFLTLIQFCQGQTLKKLSIEEQLEDIKFIKSELEKFHPGIYTYQSKVEFDGVFNELIKNLNKELSVIDFYNLVIPVVNSVGCGHTTSYIPSSVMKRALKSKTFLPIEVKISEERMYVSHVLNNNVHVHPGSEILSIDGIAISEIIQSNVNRYPSDGRILSRKYQSLAKYFARDYAIFNQSKASYQLEMNDLEGKRTFSVEGIGYEEFVERSQKPKGKDLEFSIIDSLSTAILVIRNSKSKKAFGQFLDDSFAKINSGGIKNLIVDVRDDSFNRDSDGAVLYSYLTNDPFRYYDKLEVSPHYDVPKAIRWFAHYPIEKDSIGKHYWTIHPQLEIQKPNPTSFEGKLYVLTDGFTFSAASEFSSIVRSNKRGLIIGNETGGSYYGNNSGGMLSRKLPNSRIKVYIPPMHYYMAVEDFGFYSSGVIPDVHVSPNAQDISLNTDIILHSTLNLIWKESQK